MHIQSDQDEVPRLHLRASEWYEQEGLLNEAIQHAIYAHNDERVADLIERHAPIRWLESDISIVRMASSLPTEMLVARPRLGIYQAWLLIGQGHIHRATPLLNDLSQHLVSESPDSRYQWVQSMVALIRAFIAPPALYEAILLFPWLPPFRVLMVWVYNHTKSLFVLMVLHMPIVVCQIIFRPEKISGAALCTQFILFSCALWAVAAVVLKIQTLPRLVEGNLPVEE